MHQAGKIAFLERASWTAPTIKKLARTDPLVLKAMADAKFAASARHVREKSDS